MDRQELKDGIDRVLKHLIRPLQDVQRYRRPRNVTEVQHVACLAEIGQRLAHLTAEELAIVRETIMEAGRFPKDGTWPAPAVVIQTGLALRLPEGGLTDRVRGLVRWAAGRAVFDIEDDLAWLVLWLRRNTAVPRAYDIRQIADQAEGDRRALARIRETVEAGAPITSADAELQARVARARADVAEILGASAEAAA